MEEKQILMKQLIYQELWVGLQQCIQFVYQLMKIKHWKIYKINKETLEIFQIKELVLESILIIMKICPTYHLII